MAKTTTNRRRRRGPVRRAAPIAILLALLGYFFADGVIPGLGGDAPRSPVVRGRVVTSADGAPLGDAVVRLGSATARSGADGRFEVAVEPLAAARATLTIERDGYVPEAIPVSVGEAGRIDVPEQRLDAACFVRGSVRSASFEAPVTDFRVTARRGDESIDGRVDASGGYTLGPLRVGRRYDVRVDHPSYVPTATRIEARPDAEAPVIRLMPGAVISGRVVRPDGTPIAGAAVAVRRPGNDAIERRATSDAAGAYVVAGLAGGEKVVSVEPGGTASDVGVGESVRVTVEAGGERTGVRLERRSR